MELLGKIFGCLAIVATILFIGFFMMLVTSLSGGGRFYPFVAMGSAVVLALFVIVRMFVPIRPRVQFRALAACFLLIGLTIAGYEINQAYVNSIPKVSEQDVDLDAYRPFQPGGRLAVLDKPATLALSSDLPKMDGATALYPLYAAFAQAVYPQKQYDRYDSEVMVNTTPTAYENLIDGKVDLIFAAGPSDAQLEAAKEKGVELKLTPIGREAFVFFVNAANPVTGLSSAQIREIYAGKVTNWQQVGGRDEEIRAFQRPENSGSQTMLEKIMAGRTLMKPPQEDVVSGMGGIIAKTSDYRNYQNAIGYSFLYFATEMVRNGDIRLLAIDGVTPDSSTIANKTYPFAAEFYAVTAGSKNPHVAPLIEWILSPQGQELVEKTGYTPLHR